MHINQSHLNLVFASLNKNSQRALNNVLSNVKSCNSCSSNNKGNKTYHHVYNDRIKTQQYMQRLQNAKKLNTYINDYAYINGNIKTYYHNYSNNKENNNMFIPGKRQFQSKSIIHQRSSSIDDLIRIKPHENIPKPHCKGKIQSNIKNKDHCNKECFIFE